MKGKIIKITAIVLASILALIILIAGGYVIYVAAEYGRIPDNTTLTVNGESQQKVSVGKEYTAYTYNVGFGAYSPEYSFFLDTGVMDDGTAVAGSYGKGISKEDVQKNINGSRALIEEKNADFYLLQEVDEDADRSYHINQKKLLSLANYVNVYAENFHSAYLFYPFHDPHGKSNAGIMTLSKYAVSSSVRRSLPLATDFSKFFDLDRCISVTRLPVEGSEKQFVLINVHLSAYDEGGRIRALQTEMLNEIFETERAKGNYVVAGGDFNQILRETNFPDKQQRPTWVADFPQSELPQGYRVCAPENAPTCRGADIPYEKDVNYTCVIDGFIVSDNVTVTAVETQDLQFAYSDHNPVKLTFSLNA